MSKWSIDAECPVCGGVFKKNSRTGRFQAHRWVNGCEGPSLFEETEEKRATTLKEAGEEKERRIP